MFKMYVLVLNAGSSSQKSCLYQLSDSNLPDNAPSPRWSAQIDWTGSMGTGVLTVTANGHSDQVQLDPQAPQPLRLMLETLVQGKTQVVGQLSDLDVVGHRVVHGGTDYADPVRVSPEVKATIRQLSTLAPSHNPVNLAGIEAIEQVLGGIPQVAVFDTAFHRHLPPAAATYPIPYEWFEQGIRRYGFHGISHQYCAHRAAQLLNRPLVNLKLITCHLGNGCSLAAISAGRSVDTTMGFTPLEGLMMGTRSGSIDPAILIHWLRTQNLTAEDLDRILNRESGLKGVSGLSGDLRHIQAAIAQDHPQAQLAFDLYIHRLRAGIGAMTASLGGLDVLVFTAGVGEHAAQVRQQACAGFEFLGLELDLAKNDTSPMDEDIATAASNVRVLVIHTEEDWAIAQACWRLMHECGSRFAVRSSQLGS